jgi:hypothetical protein
VRGHLAQAESDYAQAQAALKKGDLAAYAKDIGAMKKALDQAQQAAKAKTPPSAKTTLPPSGKATASPSAKATASPSASR